MTSHKTQHKRQLILDAAQAVFSQKRYCAVSMQDIASQCGISRSSVYCYFDSTFAMLHELMQRHVQQETQFILQAIERGMPAVVILQTHFLQQAQWALTPDDCLLQTMVEWFWQLGENKPVECRCLFDLRVDALEALIEYGIETQEFQCEQPRALAQTIVHLLLGLYVAASALSYTEAEIEETFCYIRQQLHCEHLL